MASSLLIAGFDVLDLTSPVQLMSGWDRGAPVPSVAEIQSTVLDGAVVSGLASGNRQPQFTLLVRGTSRAGMAATTNQILTYVDQQSWTMTFTPDGGFPVVYDCFRATTAISSTLVDDANLLQQVTIKCEALPYGRSPATVTVPLTGPALQLLDGFDADMTHRAVSGVGLNSPAGSIVSSPVVGSPGALQVNYTRTLTPISTQFTVTHSSMTAPVTGAFSTIEFYVRSDFARSLSIYSGRVAVKTWNVTLTGTSGVYHFASNLNVLPGNNFFGIVQATGTLVPAGETITAITITSPDLVINFDGDTNSTHHNMQFDSLFGVPDQALIVSDGQGSVLTLVGVAGTARTPVALQMSQVSAGTFRGWCIHTPPADSLTGQPMIPLTAGAGSTASTVRYDGTYSLWVATAAIGAVGARTIICVVSQTIGLSTNSHTVIGAPVFNNGKSLYYVGDVVLPLADYPDESSASTSVTVTSSNGTDVLTDLLLLDTRGQTVICDGGAPANLNAWIDTPAPAAAFGGVWSGPSPTRTDAASISGYLLVASTLYVNPGDTQILVFSPYGTIQGTATYSPRWLQEATS